MVQYPLQWIWFIRAGTGAGGGRVGDRGPGEGRKGKEMGEREEGEGRKGGGRREKGEGEKEGEERKGGGRREKKGREKGTPCTSLVYVKSDYTPFVRGGGGGGGGILFSLWLSVHLSFSL